MTSQPRQSLCRFAALAAVLAAVLATPAQALRVSTWNLLGYDDAAVPLRRPHMIQVVPGLDPDVMIVQELLTAPAADSFANLLKATMPARVWKGGSSTFLLTTQSAIYYDSLAVSISNLTAVATGGPRQVLVALVRPRGYLASAASFRVYSVHFKAGDGSVPSDSSQRTMECTNLRNTLNAAPAGTNILMGGDTNFYGSYETGYTRLTESQADNDGRLKDPYTLSGVWNNASYAPYHTQSPCAGAGCVGSSGGMDDRFDMLLGTYSLNDGAGLDLVSGALPGGYGAYGNDGLHYNDSIDGGGVNTAVGITVAAALRQAADHLPVIATLQLPAKLAAASAIDFGTVITGYTASQDLSVDNVPAPPAAALSYSFAAPAGFSAPGGPFNNAATAPPAVHAIGMSTASAGVKSGTLTVSSNDLDTTAKSVLLSGRVLAHAIPSLDSSVTTTLDTLDFGSVLQGTTTEISFRLFNRGYSSLQARLVRTAEFMVQAPALVPLRSAAQVDPPEYTFAAPAATPITDVATYAVTFHANGGVTDAVYDGELRIAPADEPLPGALGSDTLRVRLHAHISATGGVNDPPTAFRFAAPAPNPMRRNTLFAFDLPAEGPVALSVFDAGGRLVATVAEGVRPAGRYAISWRAARDDGSALPAGLYFARFSTPGFSRAARLVLLP